MHTSKEEIKDFKGYSMTAYSETHKEELDKIERETTKKAKRFYRKIGVEPDKDQNYFDGSRPFLESYIPEFDDRPFPETSLTDSSSSPILLSNSLP